MATLVLTAAASSFGLTGFSLFAANLAAVAIGSFIDNRLFGAGGQNQHVQQEGPRLTEISVATSSEGQPIKRLYGRGRIGGNMIWVTNFKERVETTTTTTTTSGGGGKGGGGGGGSSTTTTTTRTYKYSVSCAFAFCEGNTRVALGRIWADGRLIDTSGITFRFYQGATAQSADAKIEAVEGSGTVPGFRGICYIVFEDLELDQFGNRIPQLTAEIIKPIDDPTTDTLENLLEAVNLIPATGEVLYATTPSIKDDGFGNAIAENVHVKNDETNLELSITDLVNQVPNMATLNIAVSWFGTDLRANNIEVQPRVEVQEGKVLQPTPWNVGGLVRTDVNEVSEITIDGETRPVYGGTPSDHSLVEAIQYLCNEQGLSVCFYPFILMDIPTGNGLPDPYGGMEQDAFPWRGRITVSDPATVDETAAAQTEIDAMFGSAATGDWNVSGTTVTYTGTASDFGVRRMILHYAHLCAAIANSLDTPTLFKGFYVGTEMVAINQIRRDGVGNYPAVDAHSDLVDDVSSIFNAAGRSNVLISYAANWDEYHSHRPDDGSDDVFFNMDTIWANSNCDFIAIDNYMPISDWREGTDHEDYGTGNDSYGNPRAATIYDLDYLRGQVEGGEYYDWYYESAANRDSQTRTAIVDSAYSKDWVFRNKDISNWWSNDHYNRPGGTEDASPTSYTNSTKPIYFSEFGCPAIDKGTNQPNVFYDPKSSESAFPYYSTGERNDQIQRAYFEAMLTYWRDNSPMGMVDPTDMFAWSWDARPYPAFPFRNDIWSDTENYELGHWLNGRVGITPIGELVKLICGWVGFADNDIDVLGLVGTNAVVRGYVVDNIMSPREALNPLFAAFLFDGYESGGKLNFQLRANTLFTDLTTDDLVVDRSELSGYTITRAQETELPAASRLSFIDEEDDFQIGSTGAQRQTGSSSNVIELRFPIILTADVARILSEIVIQESWVARERIELKLPPSQLALDPGDGISLTLGSRTRKYRLTEINRASILEARGEGIEITIYDAVIAGAGGAVANETPNYGQTVLRIMDLPLVTGEETRPWAPRLAAYQNPYPPSVDVYEDTGSDLFIRSQMIAPTQMGVLAAALPAAPHTIIDEGNTIEVDWNDESFQLLSDTEENVLAGANAMAVQTSNGDWEVLQYINASFAGGRRHNLTRLIRGLLGTYPIMEDPIPAGQPIVLLDPETLGIFTISEEEKFNSLDLRYGPSVYDTGSLFFQDVTFQGQAIGQVPYPVVHIEFSTDGTDVTISWVRQTRFGGSVFDLPTVPLNEDSEQYEIDLFDSMDVLIMTVSTTSPTYVYESAPATFTATIYQISASVGRGRPASAVFGG